MPDALKVYKALADETRLRLLRLLSRGPLNVNELLDVLQMGQSRISRHLKILAEGELVDFRREGTWIYYSLNENSPSALIEDILAHLHQHEKEIGSYEADFQGLEAIVERRTEKSRRFFDSIENPQDMAPPDCLDGQAYRQLAVSLLPARCGVALDMGTGSGLLLPALLERAERVIGVDASTTMLDLARQTVGAARLRCDFRLGDLSHLPVADGEVDAVVVCMALHHLSNPPGALREARRALKSGGDLVVVDLHRHSDERLREEMADLWLGFEPAEVQAWLEKLNFTIEGADIVGDPDSLRLITFQGKKP